MKLFITMIWMAPAFIALRLHGLRDRLPDRLPVKFDAAGRAIGWMPREDAFTYEVGFASVMALIFTLALWASARSDKPEGRRAALGVAFVICQLGLVMLSEHILSRAR